MGRVATRLSSRMKPLLLVVAMIASEAAFAQSPIPGLGVGPTFSRECSHVEAEAGSVGTRFLASSGGS
jgi:hypothetical protein